MKPNPFITLRKASSGAKGMSRLSQPSISLPLPLRRRGGSWVPAGLRALAGHPHALLLLWAPACWRHHAGRSGASQHGGHVGSHRLGSSEAFPCGERSAMPCTRRRCLADVADAPVSPLPPLPGVLPGCSHSVSLQGMRAGLVDTNQSPFGSSIPSGLRALPRLLPSCPGPSPHPWFMLQLIQNEAEAPKHPFQKSSQDI